MQALIDSFKALVAIDSVSLEEDTIALYLETALLKAGLVTELDEGGNLYGYLEGTGPTVLLNVHMDTVEVARGAKLVQDEKLLKTDGTTALGADDKAAVAAVLQTLETIKAEKLAHPNLVVLITRAEELGLVGAKKVDPSKLQNIAYGFTFDASGPVGKAITAAPSQDNLHVVFHGRGAHAGFKPETGISAIMMGSDAVSAMNLLRIDEQTTANVGSFLAPGAKNVVCDKAELQFEARSLDPKKLDAQITSMIKALNDAAAKHGGSVDIEHIKQYQAYSLDSESDVMKRFQAACNTLGLPYSEAPTLGGSDANILNGLGIPTLVCSIGYEDPHTVREYIPISELEKLYALVLELATL